MLVLLYALICFSYALTHTTAGAHCLWGNVYPPSKLAMMLYHQKSNCSWVSVSLAYFWWFLAGIGFSVISGKLSNPPRLLFQHCHVCLPTYLHMYLSLSLSLSLSISFSRWIVMFLWFHCPPSVVTSSAPPSPRMTFHSSDDTSPCSVYILTLSTSRCKRSASSHGYLMCLIDVP